MRVAILKASWANLKMCDAEWMFFWMDCRTVSNQRAFPGLKQVQTVNFFGMCVFLAKMTVSYTCWETFDFNCAAFLQVPFAAVSMVEANSHC